MALIYDLLLFLIFIFILSRSSVLVVRASKKLSGFLRLSEFATGFLFLAIATSLPELFVGIDSAITGNSILGLGNIIGSNIANITLVTGVVILFSGGINVNSRIVRRDSFYVLLVMGLMVLLIFDKTLSRADGIILLGVFVLYAYKILRERKKFNKKVEPVSGLVMFNHVMLFLLGIGLILISAHFVVKFAVSLATGLGIPALLMGLFLVALGTSVPELVLSLRASLSKSPRLGLGNIIGSNVANSSLILGLMAVINPFSFDSVLFLVSILVMLFSGFLFMLFINTSDRLTKKEGLTLLFIYIGFIFVEFLIK